jgi:protease-4
MYNNITEQTYNIKKIYVKTIMLILIIIIIIFVFNKSDTDDKHIAIIEINGIITEKNNNSKTIINLLDNAFLNKNCKAIILKINSPGGTPVQTNIIHNYIKKLRNTKKKNIYSIIEDIGTSGAYLIATATEKIYCDPSSIIGSIGVIITSFGFVETLNKIGVERRIYKAGKHKAIMDPFTEKNKNEEIIIQHNLEIIHENFINTVKKNRPNLSTSLQEEIFSGKFWTGKDAIELGLIDGFYDIYTFSSEIIDVNKTIDYTKENILNTIINNLFKK